MRQVLPLDRVLDAPQAQAGEKVSGFSFQGYEFQTPDLPLGAVAGGAAGALPPPLLGEHTAEIMARLGCSESEIAGAVGSGAAVVADREARLWALPVERKVAF